jgi:ribonuclease D
VTGVRFPVLVTDDVALGALAERLGGASRIAVDVEANGMYAYRPRLCTVQIAVRIEDRVEIAVVDTLAVDVGPLRDVLGADGPLKVLHDLTFDAELLAGAGAPLGRVRDTSVAARFLGHEATGLGTVLEKELGVSVDKSLQQHDWGRRPISEAEMTYLATDVAHLLSLDDRLTERARTLDILDEVEIESSHRARQSETRLADPQPAYTRVKHATSLATWLERAVLRRVYAVRERLAEEADVPAHRIVSNEMLLQLCRDKPTSAGAFRAIVERRRPGLAPEPFCHAVRQGLADGDVPPEDRVWFERPALPIEVTQRRRRREGQLQTWRRSEAQRRGVSEQAILPGHCLQAVARILADVADLEERRARIVEVPALGEKRLAAYLEAWLAFEEIR